VCGVCVGVVHHVLQVGEPLVTSGSRVTCIAPWPARDGSLQLVCVLADKSLRVLENVGAVNGTQPALGHRRSVSCVAVATRPPTPPAGPGVCSPTAASGPRTVVATGSWDGTIRLWDAGTGGQLVAPLRAPGTWFDALVLVPNPVAGSICVAAGSAPDAHVWEVSVDSLPSCTLVETARATVGPAAALGESVEDGVVLVSSGGLGATALPQLSFNALGLSASPTGGLVLARGGQRFVDTFVGVCDALSTRRVPTPAAESSVVSLVTIGQLQPEGCPVVASAWDNGEVWVWELSAPSPSGSGLGSHLGEMCGAHRGALTIHGGVVEALVFAPPSHHRTLLASASLDGTVHVTDVATGFQLYTIFAATERVKCLASGCGPGGEPLWACCEVDGTVHLRDVETGSLQGDPLPPGSSRVSCVALGSGVLVTGGDCVRVWDLGTRTLHWVSRTPWQKLDCTGLQLAGCRGLSRTNQDLIDALTGPSVGQSAFTLVGPVVLRCRGGG
jgi:WD40 repeat protein